MEFTFVLREGSAAELFHRWLQKDIQSARLSPAHRAYYQLRWLMPIGVRQWLQRVRAPTQVDPRWYLPEKFYRELAAAVAASGSGRPPIIHPWPRAARSALALSHDVETKEGIANIPRIADMEQELGFRSSWYFVARKYPVDQGLLRDLRQRGFEVGVHGYNHDGRLYSSSSVFQRRVPVINETIREFQAEGFRSPMVHRDLDWLQQLHVKYDASCFDVDPFQPMPGGVGSIWPFRAGRLVELPYTLPQDHTLFVVLGEKDDRIWRHKAEWLADRGGMILALTHPDYLDTPWKLSAYRDFLEHMREQPQLWWALPREVAAWWQLREQSSVASTADGNWQLRGPAAEDGRLAWVTVDDAGLVKFAAIDQLVCS